MTSDIAGLAHVYPNVWRTLLASLISTTAAHRLLHELIDVCDANRVIWVAIHEVRRAMVPDLHFQCIDPGAL